MNDKGTTFHDNKDDRQEFEAHKQEMCLALGKDTQAFKQSIDTMLALDAYDYSYLWSWMGVPIIQLPADIMATQEIIWNTRPDIIIETGVARGGSMIFMASLLAMTGNDKRGGSVCLNRLRRFAKWISASIMPRPSFVPAR